MGTVMSDGHELTVGREGPILARERVWRLVNAARRVADAHDPLGRQARQRWQEKLGLSSEAIELGIRCGLETQPTQEDVATLCANVAPAPRVWVVLSANVFVAAHRSIALGLAASPHVFVKASRRDPVLAKLLHEIEPELFTLVDHVAPEPGDHIYAYGRAPTLATLRASLPTGVSWHAHGPGLGVAVVGGGGNWRVAAEAIALDAVVFEQRGCLSPQLVGLTPQVPVEPFCAHLAQALRDLGERVPAPQPTGDERAQRTWFELVGAYAGALHPAGPGVVFAYTADLHEAGVRREPFIPLPPPSRSLTVFSAPEPLRAMSALQPWVTTVATEVADEPEARRWFPAARLCRYGQMQQPRLDGPVDRRPGSRGEAT